MSARYAFAGFTLVEVLVAMTAGLVVIGSALQALALNSRHHARNSDLAVLQDQANAALRFIARDLRLAGHFGLAGAGADVQGRSVDGDDNPLGLPIPGRCDAAFVLSLHRSVEIAPNADRWNCGVTAVGGADTLVLRSAGAEVVAPQAARLQLAAALGDGRITASTVANAGEFERRHLQIYGYYVAERSTLFPDQPVLRRLTLRALTSGPLFVDEEVTAGIETLQLRAAIDTDLDGLADMWIDANDPRLAERTAGGGLRFPPLAIEVGIVVRSESPVWHDGAPPVLDLADRRWTPPDDGYLRLVARRTVRLRNARPAR